MQPMEEAAEDDDFNSLLLSMLQPTTKLEPPHPSDTPRQSTGADFHHASTSSLEERADHFTLTASELVNDVGELYSNNGECSWVSLHANPCM